MVSPLPVYISGAATDHDLGIGVGFGRTQTAAGLALHHTVERIDAEGATGDDGPAGVSVGAGNLQCSCAAFPDQHAAAARTFGIHDRAGKLLHCRGLARIQPEGGASHQTVVINAGCDVFKHGSGLRGGEFAWATDMQQQFTGRPIDADIGRRPASGIIVVE